MTWLQILTYVAVFGAMFAMLAKALRYLRAPEHFRWELYPVPHEKGRADYGGSYLEELDWWKKPPQIDRVRELKEMMAEVILLKGVFLHNRKVWIFSFPFHLGMYICIGWLLLLLGGAILQAAEVSIGPDAGVVGSVIHYLTVGTGYVVAPSTSSPGTLLSIRNTHATVATGSGILSSSVIQIECKETESFAGFCRREGFSPGDTLIG